MANAERLLIFDGDCGFCGACARWMERRWSRTPRPRAIAWQSLDREQPPFETPTLAQFSESVWWIDGERREAGSRAIAHALLAATRPWPLVGVALRTPPLSWAAAPLYRSVARHRHRFPGATSACATGGSARHRTGRRGS